MNTYLLLFILSTCASLVFTPVVSRISERFGWVDNPRDGRHVHRNPVPRLGGVAIFAAVLLALATLPFINNLVTQTLRTNGAQLWRVLVPATFIFLIGVYDDFRGTNAPVKFTAQGLAGLLFCVMGGRIEALSVPLVGSIELHPVLGYALTLLWTVGICNAFNLIDGMDGLGAGASLFAALVMLVVSLMLGHPLVTIVAVMLAVALKKRFATDEAANYREARISDRHAKGDQWNCYRYGCRGLLRSLHRERREREADEK